MYTYVHDISSYNSVSFHRSRLYNSDCIYTGRESCLVHHSRLAQYWSFWRSSLRCSFLKTRTQSSSHRHHVELCLRCRGKVNRLSNKVSLSSRWQTFSTFHVFLSTSLGDSVSQDLIDDRILLRQSTSFAVEYTD